MAIAMLLMALACGPVHAAALHDGRDARDAPARYELSEPHMGTTFRLVFYAHSAAAAREAGRAAFSRIAEIDRSLSDYRHDSDVMQLCRAAGGESRPVSRDFVAVWRIASRLAAASGGAFDVTAGPLTRLWRRARRLSERPSESAIHAARALTDPNGLDVHVEADGSGTARLARAGMCLDFGGIAKGYAADAALAVLRAREIDAALVAAGGDLAIGDAPPGTDGWQVTIAPLGDAKPPVASLTLTRAGVSTSGDAEQWVELDGVRYSHILDPRTGMPLTGRRSVTVIARDATWSDALATAISVLGRDGFEVAARLGSAATLMGIEQAGGHVEWSTSDNWGRLSGTADRSDLRARIHADQRTRDADSRFEHGTRSARMRHAKERATGRVFID